MGKWRYDLLRDQLVQADFTKSFCEAFEDLGVPIERGVAHNR